MARTLSKNDLNEIKAIVKREIKNNKRATHLAIIKRFVTFLAYLSMFILILAYLPDILNKIFNIIYKLNVKLSSKISEL